MLRSILLTGGAGFIGSALARHLLASESLERLVILDKLAPTGNAGNLIGPDQDPRFHFTAGDISDRSLVARLLSEHDVTGIFNLAVETDPDRSAESSAELLATNVNGIASLLEVSRAARVPLLQCSTDDVHGSIAPPDRSSELSPLRPTTAYAASKAAADLLCQAATRSHAQDIVITRATTTYGPRQHHAELIPTLVRRALRDEPLALEGSGMCIRDWIHVDDHCRGLLSAFTKGAPGALYYFGGQCERTNLGLARDVLRILSKPESLLSFAPERPGHDQRHAVDCNQALGKLRWQPEVKFQSAFPSVVRELAANLSAS